MAGKQENLRELQSEDMYSGATTGTTSQTYTGVEIKNKFPNGRLRLRASDFKLLYDIKNKPMELKNWGKVLRENPENKGKKLSRKDYENFEKEVSSFQEIDEPSATETKLLGYVDSETLEEITERKNDVEAYLVKVSYYRIEKDNALIFVVKDKRYKPGIMFSKQYLESA